MACKKLSVGMLVVVNGAYLRVPGVTTYHFSQFMQQIPGWFHVLVLLNQMCILRC